MLLYWCSFTSRFNIADSNHAYSNHQQECGSHDDLSLVTTTTIRSYAYHSSSLKGRAIGT